MQTKLLISIFLLLFYYLLPAQTYTDIVQLTIDKKRTLGITDMLTDDDYKYMVVYLNKGKKGESIYFNLEKVYEIEEDYGKYTYFIIKLSESNEYISHIKLYDTHTISKIKLIDGEIYYMTFGVGYENRIKRYVEGGEPELIFEYKTGGDVRFSDFILSGDTLIIGGGFTYQEYIEIKGDTVYHPALELDWYDHSTPCNFIYSIDMLEDEVIYSFGYGGRIYYSVIREMRKDKSGNLSIMGEYGSDKIKILGEELRFRGGLGGNDSYIARITPQGEKVSVNTFSSWSLVDLVTDIIYSEDGSYYVSIASRDPGEYSLDSILIEKSSEFHIFHYLAKFDNAGKIVWYKEILSDGGSLFYPLYEMGSRIVYGGAFTSNNRKLVIDGQEIDAEIGITNTILFELSKETGEVLHISEIISNGDDVRIVKNGYCKIGDLNTIVMSFREEGIVLNGEDVPKYYNGKLVHVLMNVEFESAGGSEENAEDKFAIYPNPVMGGAKIQIKGLDTREFRYNITNVKGALLLSGIVSGEKGIDVGKLGSGVYYFEIYGNRGDKKMVQTFIKL